MGMSPFRLPTERNLETSVDVEPVANALNSLALLNATERLPALDAWVTRTAAALTPEQRRANRLVFDGLGYALPLERSFADFPAYLADLEQQRPEVLRDQFLRALLRQSHRQSGAAEGLPDRAAPLADFQTYLAYLEQLDLTGPVDRALQGEVHRLLNDPPAMHDLIVTHLRAMWEGVLEAEWQKVLPGLQGQVHTLTRGGDDGPTGADKLAQFIGRSPGEDVQAGLPGDRAIIFVPSPHVGRYVTRLEGEATIWRFFDAPRNFPVLMRSAPVGRAELIGRLNALADDTRLRILELFAEHDQLSAQEIMATLNLPQSSVSRYLKQLGAYVFEQRGGTIKRYRFSPASLELTFQALGRLLAGQERPQERPEDARGAFPAELRRFLDRQGRVTGWPTRAKDKIILLEYFASRFEPGRDYSEKEVNAVLLAHMHPFFKDYVTIRRALYDYRFFDRERDGSRYWRAEPGAPAAD